MDLTASERYLSRICSEIFLSPWSYPRVYRKVSKSEGSSKEICDLLIVYKNKVIIFSDKDCQFPNSGRIKTDWRRWYKKAICKSVSQARGAEKWIRSNPDNIFTDRKCTRPFPLDVSATDSSYHIVIVARGCEDRCRRHFKGGSGCLMVHSKAPDDMPFSIGDFNRDKTFVHVLTDTSLNIVLRTLDTVTDFTSYLEKKEKFLRSKYVIAPGEEELLSVFMQNVSTDGQHDFDVLDVKSDGVMLDEGMWYEFERSPMWKARVEANKVSYIWDNLIKTFNDAFMSKDQYLDTSFEDHEKIFRVMASEDRLRRRMLSEALIDLLKKDTSGDIGVRIVEPSASLFPYYIFLVLSDSGFSSYGDYRTYRKNLLESYMRCLKLNYEDAKDIVGIATEPGIDNSHRSEDIAYLDVRDWTVEDRRIAETISKELSIYRGDSPRTYIRANEYPLH